MLIAFFSARGMCSISLTPSMKKDTKEEEDNDNDRMNIICIQDTICI